MQITTSQTFPATPDQLWPLLFHSRMDDRQPCSLLCGLPKPVECRLADAGGIGGTRECISDRGTIRQRILDWQPGVLLRFELEATDLYFGPCVQSIVETFEIVPLTPAQSRLRRRTQFSIKPLWRPLLTLPMAIGLKSIHRYVFRNWQRIVLT